MVAQLVGWHYATVKKLAKEHGLGTVTDEGFALSIDEIAFVAREKKQRDGQQTSWQRDPSLARKAAVKGRQRARDSQAATYSD